MPRQRTRATENEPQDGLVRVVSDDDELDDELDDPFATDVAPPGAVTPRRPTSARGSGHDEDLSAEVNRLRSENARLRAVAGLEGRREESATVGDLLDLNAVHGDLIRGELERVLEDHSEALCERLAERIEERLLDTTHGDNEEEYGAVGGVTATRRRQTRRSSSARKRPGRKRGHLYRDEDGSVYLWDKADEPDVVADGEFVEPA